MNPTQCIAWLALVAGVVAPAHIQSQENFLPALAHSHQEFSLTVMAPYEQAFPLFGAYEERKWAKGFDPKFLHPSRARDQQGMVFTWSQNGTPSLWMNTAFDVLSGHVQYVYVITDAMVTLIDIHLARLDETSTRVSLVYERTALRLEANEQVAQQANDDRNKGAVWAEMINGYLATARTAPARTK
jgi:hypothetical protein